MGAVLTGQVRHVGAVWCSRICRPERRNQSSSAGTRLRVVPRLVAGTPLLREPWTLLPQVVPRFRPLDHRSSGQREVHRLPSLGLDETTWVFCPTWRRSQRVAARSRAGIRQNIGSRSSSESLNHLVGCSNSMTRCPTARARIAIPVSAVRIVELNPRPTRAPSWRDWSMISLSAIGSG